MSESTSLPVTDCHTPSALTCMRATLICVILPPVVVSTMNAVCAKVAVVSIVKTSSACDKTTKIPLLDTFPVVPLI